MLMEQDYCIGSNRLRVKWDNEELGHVIGMFFAPWICTDGEPNDEIAVTSTDTGYNLKETKNSQSFHCSDKMHLVGELERIMTTYAQQSLDALLQIHSACVDFNGQGVLIVGTHGIGKTTLALESLKEGFRALTDDISVIDMEFRTVKGFPRPFRVKMNAQGIASDVPDDCPTYDLYDGFTYVFFHFPEERYYTDVTEIKHVIFPRRYKGPTQISPIGETDAVRLIIQEGINFYRKDDGCVSDVIELIRAAQPFELFYEDKQDAVSHIRQMLQ